MAGKKSIKLPPAFYIMSILLLLLLIAISMPNINGMTEDSKKVKAKQDCDTIAQGIQKFNSLEDVQVKTLMDLKGKYIMNIDTLKDPWGSNYDMDPRLGIVLSKGPDMLASVGTAANYNEEESNLDNIAASYTGALRLTCAKIEAAPRSSSQAGNKQYDVLHLYFNKDVNVSGIIDLQSASTAEVAPASGNGTAAAGAIFRYYTYDEKADKYVIADPRRDIAGFEKLPKYITSAPLDPSEKSGFAYERSLKTGSYSYGADSREILIRFPEGCSNVLIPHRHAINLTGSRHTGNAVFESNPIGPGGNGAEASETPIVIRPY